MKDLIFHFTFAKSKHTDVDVAISLKREKVFQNSFSLFGQSGFVIVLQKQDLDYLLIQQVETEQHHVYMQTNGESILIRVLIAKDSEKHKIVLNSFLNILIEKKDK